MNTKNNQKNKTGAIETKKEKSSSKINNLVKSTVLGVDITNESKENILEYIIKKIENTQENFYIVTPNPEMIIAAQKNEQFQKVLNEAGIALCDGVGLYLAAKMLGKPLQERVTGVDLVEGLCERVANRPITVGFLGAGPNVADKASKCLLDHFFTLDVVYVSEEWDEDKGKEDFPLQRERIKVRGRLQSRKRSQSFPPHPDPLLPGEGKKDIDILFVAFGHPKQELWMREHLNKIPVRVMVGVGGAFDYISGNIPRAPRFLRQIGLEWFYRLVRQPWRWKRQLALVEFVGMVIKEKITKSY